MTDRLRYLHEGVLPAAFRLLPAKMVSPEAQAMLLAIALQESGLAHRRQVGGPAVGFWQFERGGVADVLTDPETKALARSVCNVLLYPPNTYACYYALADNDVLAACFARLLLWTNPQALPCDGGADKGWVIYNETWRPGKLRPNDWPGNFAQAWAVVNGAAQ